MNLLALPAWLVLGAAFLVWGLLTAALRRDARGALSAVILMLGAATVALAALVRHAVLPMTGVSTLLAGLVLGLVLVLVAVVLKQREEGS